MAPRSHKAEIAYCLLSMNNQMSSYKVFLDVSNFLECRNASGN